MDAAVVEHKDHADDKPHGWLRRWREDGRLVVESFWRNGEPQRYVAYFPGGQKRFTADGPLPMDRDRNQERFSLAAFRRAIAWPDRQRPRGGRTDLPSLRSDAEHTSPDPPKSGARDR